VVCSGELLNAEEVYSESQQKSCSCPNAYQHRNNFPTADRQQTANKKEFDDDERPALPELIDRSIEMIESFVTAGAELTMTRFNK